MKHFTDRVSFLAVARSRAGFTLIEIVIVVVIISLAAMMSVPMISGAASMQLKSAGNMIAADLEYAKSLAVSRGEDFAVEFDTSTESYRITDSNGVVIEHPVKRGEDYVVDFAGDSRLDRVDISTVNFDGTSDVIFDYLGSPYDGNNNPLNTGEVSLSAGGSTVTVTVEPVTGFISVN